MRVAIYIRVSSEEQLDGHSLSAQLDIARNYALQRGWEIVEVFEERGRSGKSALRPEFQRMVRTAEAGLFDTIIVHKLDRFSRSLVDTVGYLNRFNSLGVSLVSITENFDFTTPAGKMMLGMIALLAEWYVDNLSQETSKGKRQRAQKGGWNGTLPFGYTTIRKMQAALVHLGEQFKEGAISEDEYSQIAGLYETCIEQNQASSEDTDALICPVNGPGVVFAFETYSLGIYSDNDIAIMLNQQGYQTTGQWGANRFGKDTVLPILQNRFYVGETSYQGKKKGAQKQYIPGKHEALISVELFEKCQAVRAKRAGNWNRGAPNQQETYPLSSILICPICGSKWRGAKVREQRRYRDPAKDRAVDCCSTVKSIAANVLEDAAAEILLSISLPEDWQQHLITMLENHQPQHSAMKAQRSQLETRLERLKQLFVMGDLSEKEYQTMRDELKDMLTQIQLPNHGTMIDLERATYLLGNIKEVWEHATLEEREVWFKLMFEKIYVENGDIKAVEPTI